MPGQQPQADGTPMTNRIDYAVRLKIELDHPAEKVWPMLLHWDLWVNDTEYREYRVAGTPDTEGEVKHILHFDETGRLDFSFFAEVVKIIPHERLIYKLLTPLSAFAAATGCKADVVYTGYEVFELREFRGKVLFTFDLYAEEVRDTALPKEEARRIGDEFVKTTEERWYGRYFPRLEALLARQ